MFGNVMKLKSFGGRLNKVWRVDWIDNNVQILSFLFFIVVYILLLSFNNLSFS